MLLKNLMRNIVLTFLIFLFSYTLSPGQEIDSRPDSLKIETPNPTGALLRSAFVPGWGQFYNKKYIKATIIAGIEIYLINGVYTHWRDADRHKTNFQGADDDPDYQALEFSRYESALDKRGTFTWFLVATVFYSMFDAYVDAHLSNFDQEDKAFQVYLGPGDKDEIKLALTFNIP